MGRVHFWKKKKKQKWNENIQLCGHARAGGFLSFNWGDKVDSPCSAASIFIKVPRPMLNTEEIVWEDKEQRIPSHQQLLSELAVRKKDPAPNFIGIPQRQYYMVVGGGSNVSVTRAEIKKIVELQGFKENSVPSHCTCGKPSHCALLPDLLPLIPEWH